MGRYALGEAKLEIIQGFAYLEDNKKTEENEKFNRLNLVLLEKEKEIELLKASLDSTSNQQQLSEKVFRELNIQYPEIISFACQPTFSYTDSSRQMTTLVVIGSDKKLDGIDKEKIEKWLSVRMNQNQLTILYEAEKER